MLYQIFADLVGLIHFFWIIFLLIGVFWGRKNLIVKYIHFSGLAYAFYIQIFDLYCPLTFLEVWLRQKGDPSQAYEGSFIVYYLEKLIYIEIDQWIISTLTILLVLLNIYFYLSSGVRRHRRI